MNVFRGPSKGPQRWDRHYCSRTPTALAPWRVTSFTTRSPPECRGWIGNLPSPPGMCKAVGVLVAQREGRKGLCTGKAAPVSRRTPPPPHPVSICSTLGSVPCGMKLASQGWPHLWSFTPHSRASEPGWPPTPLFNLQNAGVL